MTTALCSSGNWQSPSVGISLLELALLGATGLKVLCICGSTPVVDALVRVGRHTYQIHNLCGNQQILPGQTGMIGTDSGHDYKLRRSQDEGTLHIFGLAQMHRTHFDLLPGKPQAANREGFVVVRRVGSPWPVQL